MCMELTIFDMQCFVFCRYITNKKKRNNDFFCFIVCQNHNRKMFNKLSNKHMFTAVVPPPKKKMNHLWNYYCCRFWVHDVINGTVSNQMTLTGTCLKISVESRWCHSCPNCFRCVTRKWYGHGPILNESLSYTN